MVVIEPLDTAGLAQFRLQVEKMRFSGEITSDEADEIHAHTGGDGFELEVPAGPPTTGEFTPTQPGSVEVESHHLAKGLVILNVS